jgi:hypothetical protein
MNVLTRWRRSAGATLNKPCHALAHTPFTHTTWTRRNTATARNVALKLTTAKPTR